jgi:glycosyltransferase involved in cell wall biosynthesis
LTDREQEVRPTTAGSHLHLVVPGALDQRTGGYLYDARMVEELRRRGWRVTVHSLEGRFPDPDPRARGSLEGTLSRIPPGGLVLLDGLAMGGLPDVLEGQGSRLRLVALVHHPLADETGLDPGQRERLAELERRALAACRGVVVTSPFTADRVEDALGVSRERIRVAPPGTRPAPPAVGPGPLAPPRMLCVGAVIPRKGQDVLVEALATLREAPWSCTIAGSLARAPDFARSVRRRVEALGLEGRVRFPGELEEGALDRLYHTASLLVLPSHYEGYGMVLTEALARGLPVVSTTGGAIPGTVPSTAGILVPPGNAPALANALRRLLDGGERARFAQAATAHARRFRDWDAAAGVLEEALLDLGRGKAAEGTPPTRAPVDRTPTEGMSAERAPADTFSPDWLELREPVDHRSRPSALLRPLRAAWHARGWHRVLDLGSGTGSNFRYLSPRLPGRQAWTLVDHDPSLLARFHGPDPGPEVRRVEGDLETEGLSRVAEAHLVTASALLDLVSDAWLTDLVDACRRAGAGALLALSYDGSVTWSPSREARGEDRREGEEGGEDSWVLETLNAHQQGEKGMGRALGPSAPHRARALFQGAGFHTWLLPSPWHLAPGDRPLALALLEGWVEALLEESPESEERIRRWHARRREGLEQGERSLTVGHLDLLAIPSGEAHG